MFCLYSILFFFFFLKLFEFLLKYLNLSLVTCSTDDSKSGFSSLLCSFAPYLGCKLRDSFFKNIFLYVKVFLRQMAKNLVSWKLRISSLFPHLKLTAEIISLSLLSVLFWFRSCPDVLWRHFHNTIFHCLITF